MRALPDGFSARAIRPDTDVGAVLELANEAAIAAYGVASTDERMVRGGWAMPSFKPQRDSVLVLDPSGRAAATAGFYDGQALHIAPYLWFAVRPGAPVGVAEAVCAWAAERAPQNLSLAPAGARVALHTDVAAVNTADKGALERAGWRHERTNWVMEIDLEGPAPLPEPAWPEGITVRTADLERDARAIHQAETDSFSDHYGYVPQRFEEWFYFKTQFLKAEPELWILAMDGDTIAGIALCSSTRPGDPDLGWISTVGVRRPWRRRGLALAILHHSFRLLAAQGKLRAGLGVDSQSLTGATRLYEKAGMRVVREGHEYELLIRDGEDLRTLQLDEKADAERQEAPA
jgi:ribosomal protein S18 acetylase RimI-like enzyme